MNERPRRLRRNELIREMVCGVRLTLSSLVQPYFLLKQSQRTETIAGFSNVSRMGVDPLSKKMEADVERGLKSFLLFASSEEKDREGRNAYRPDAVLPETVRVLRTRFGSSILLLSDVCLCPYTDHGHCGVLREEIENDISLEPLTKMALVHAQAGVDLVAPSDMMDGRVGAIRKTLDDNGFMSTGILSYTAKYASNYYGPFREALGCTPKFTSRASYQMDYRNQEEALRELDLDLREGADAVMVKPALAYLDVIALMKAHSSVPVAAYSVSGEYQMAKLLSESGMASERELVIENLTAIRRAGAQIIVTYSASECAEKGWVARG